MKFTEEQRAIVFEAIEQVGTLSQALSCSVTSFVNSHKKTCLLNAASASCLIIRTTDASWG